jgi:hypothetical protein
LRSVSKVGEEGSVRRGIFAGRHLAKSTTTPRGGQAVSHACTPCVAVGEDGRGDDPPPQEDEEVLGQAGENETVRLQPQQTEPDSLATAQSTPQKRAVYASMIEDDATEATPKAAPESELVVSGPRKVEGVEVELESVQAGINKIWSSLGEMMRQGVAKGKVVEQTPESTV